ncbi:MAG TPA: 3-hydroxyacyl-CoA dehydrogenase NAD-binding domain-containing protein, partial [Afifellaceae bacterium]|nr:3-hydroxyacyl-CoA dehydrogenase NAD-binding domain-containing protein [Afifellaceae bacterium]
MTDTHQMETVRIAFTESGGERVAVVTIDNPPVNAGDVRVRRDLLEALSILAGDTALGAAVLTGANGNFVAGSDIREFDSDPVEPHLPDVITALENLSIPVVAAIEGAALGGGYELALGCDRRLATARAVVGLPEVTLGLIPGAGGTVRLPRLTGPARAIELVTSGRRLKAREALDIGMIDAIADDDLLAGAIRLAATRPPKRIVVNLPAIGETDQEIEAAAEAARRKAKGAVAVAEAIKAVKASQKLPAGEALEADRATSLRLRREPQSQALRHLFLAQRAAMRPPKGACARSVADVGVAGAGRMGLGIALAFAARGYTVRIAEQNPDVLAAARGSLTEMAGQMAARNRIRSADNVMARIEAGSLETLSDASLVVEAITEDMQAKKDLLTELDGLLAPGTILASNTSYLDINELATAVSQPERLAGMHFFNPAQIMKLVEIIRTDATSDDTVATLLELCRKLGKIAVIARVGEGFIGNRIFNAYRTQCEFLLEEGCYPVEIDRAMTAFGMAMGPFAVFDLAGLDIAWAMRKRLAPTRDPQARYVSIPDRLCELGRFGRRAGMGWYDYADDAKGSPAPQVDGLIDAASAEKNIARRAFDAGDIQWRLLAAIVNEAAWTLADGIAARSGDIDLVLVNGYGFPALKGGPLHWAAH